MSFSQDVKAELTKTECNDCCKRAEAYGMFLFGRGFSKDEMNILTDYENIALRYSSSAEYLTGRKAQIKCSKSKKYTVYIGSYEERIDILHELGYLGNEFSFSIKYNNIENECCNGAFIRGAFLSCGTVTNPEKEYHLEFSVSQKSKCGLLCEAFRNFEVTPKIAQRNGCYIIYFKDSEQISDILALMGASMSAMQLINTVIYKDVRNHVNRKVNCENANMVRACNAAVTQIDAIKKIINKKGLDYLPEHLREIALLRLDNPDMSLNELCKNLKEPITRSGLNHRLKKIEEIAKTVF